MIWNKISNSPQKPIKLYKMKITVLEGTIKVFLMKINNRSTKDLHWKNILIKQALDSQIKRMLLSPNSTTLNKA